MTNESGDRQEQDGLKLAHKAEAVTSTGAARAHTWRNIGLIVEREYKTRVRQRSFVITTIVLLALVGIAAFIPTISQYLASRGSAPTRVVVVNNVGIIAGLDESALESYMGVVLNGANTGSSAPYTVVSQPQSDLTDLQAQVKNGKLAVLLVLARASNQDLSLTYYTNSSSASDSNLSQIQALASALTFRDRAQRLGLAPSQTQSLLAPPSLTVVNTRQNQNARPSNEITAGYVLAIVGSYLGFLAVVGYEANVAQGVAEEKGNRVMEILVNATTPFQLMVGKIVGIGAVCLTQMTYLVVVGIGALLLQTPIQTALFGANSGGFTQFLTSVSIPFYVLFLVYFVLEFFMYASIYAGLGALVKRSEEVQSLVMVPTLLLAAFFVVTFFGFAHPDADWVRVLSYIPCFTPTFVLLRLALGTVAWWEIVLTILLMLGTTFAFALVAVQVYRLGVLMYGQRPTLGQLVRIMRSTNSRNAAEADKTVE